jgi:hypothetical protein
MKISELEGYESLLTKADLEELKREMKLELRELRVEFKTEVVGIRDQLQRIRILIWLPVITGAIQILVLLIRH